MKKDKRTFKQWISDHKPTKRRIIQLYAALLTNANLKGFGSGQIYQGNVKSVCAPGLNCYSCPAASAACPLGALQNALGSSNARLPYYMLGILLLFGILFGRWICGFLCPFGLIQDLLHKIKTPKIRKSPITRILSYMKYVILVVFVVVLPLIYATRSFPMPAFCKYICPSGTLLGAGGLLSNENNTNMFPVLGPLFTWKFCLLVVFVIGAIFVYRFFCRFFCPLGAIYGLFNRISILGIKLDKPKCTDCGLCVATCEMDIKHVADHECISCGKCVNVCPTGAISYKGPKILLAPNAIGGRPSAAAKKRVDPVDAPGTPLPKKTRIARLIVGLSMLAVLCFALIYYNFFDKDPAPIIPNQNQSSDIQTSPDPTTPTAIVGSQVGNLCYDYELDVYGEDRTVSVEDSRGKITLVNFWYIYCGSCVKELQTEFPLIKEEYGDNVEILAVHSYEEYGSDIPAFISDNFPNADFTFCRDGEGEEYFRMLGGSQAWPITVVLDQNGIIVSTIYGSTTYDELKATIDSVIKENAPDNANTGNNVEGKEVGNLCYDIELPVYGSGNTVSVADFSGKVTILNFWYIYCGSCVKELQTEFPLIKDEYGDQVEILTVHSYEEYDRDIPAFIEESFPDAQFTFCRDIEGEAYFRMLGGSQAWPVTVVLDRNGVIVTTIYGSTTYDELKQIIESIPIE